MNTKEICEKLSISEKALRIYEDKGLLHVHRSKNNYRDYTVNDMVRLRAILLMKNLGFSLNEIKDILDKNEIGEDNLNNIYMQLQVIDNKLAELRETKKNIQKIINDSLRSGTDNKDIYDILGHCGGSGYDDLLKSWNFDKMASNYIEQYMLLDKEYSEVMHIVACKIRALGADRRIIDIGAGIGNLWQTFDASCDLTAFDNSLNMLWKTRENLPWAKLVLGDILELQDNAIGLFDIVVSTYVLHHIPYEYQMLAFTNILQYCKPDGYIVFADRNVWDQAGKKKLEELFLRTGRYARLEVTRTEYYLYGSEFCAYLDANNYSYEMQLYGEEALLLVIKNHSRPAGR